MTAQIIDGTAIAQAIQDEVAGRGLSSWNVSTGIVPGLATVLVGDNPASQT